MHGSGSRGVTLEAKAAERRGGSTALTLNPFRLFGHTLQRGIHRGLGQRWSRANAELCDAPSGTEERKRNWWMGVMLMKMQQQLTCSRSSSEASWAPTTGWAKLGERNDSVKYQGLSSAGWVSLCERKGTMKYEYSKCKRGFTKWTLSTQISVQRCSTLIYALLPAEISWLKLCERRKKGKYE